MNERAVVLQAASILLQYPDARVLAALPTVRRAVSCLTGGSAPTKLLALADHLADGDPAVLERDYVSTLDRRKRCCLYLTWWTDGETRRRGLSLARLKALYRSRGVELETGELPDFLPVVLEFAATADLDLGVEILQEHRAGVELLRLALLDVGSPYAGAVEAVCSVLPGASPADEAAARALARSGPPGELVGVDGYGAIGESVGPTSLRPTGPGAFVPLESLGVRR